MLERGDLGTEEGLRLSQEATERAMALDDSLAEAHAQLGWIKMCHGWDWAGARMELEKALALEPESIPVLDFAAVLMAAQGRLRESNEIRRRILELDPLSIMSQRSSTVTLRWEGRFDEALAAAQTVLELDPHREDAHADIGQIYLLQAKPDEALQAFQQEAFELSRLYGLVMAYHALGRKAESDAALATFKEKYQDTSAYDIASLHAFRGETDRAFEWLDRAYTRRDRVLTWMKVDPNLQSLRGDPRWLPFLRRMRLTE